MLKIELTAESREGKEQFGNFDVAAYSRKTFGMFAGEDETVTLICEDALTGVMIDRFGKEVAMRRYDETRIRVRVSVAVSASSSAGWRDLARQCGLSRRNPSCGNTASIWKLF